MQIFSNEQFFPGSLTFVRRIPQRRRSKQHCNIIYLSFWIVFVDIIFWIIQVNLAFILICIVCVFILSNIPRVFLNCFEFFMSEDMLRFVFCVCLFCLSLCLSLCLLLCLSSVSAFVFVIILSLHQLEFIIIDDIDDDRVFGFMIDFTFQVSLYFGYMESIMIFFSLFLEMTTLSLNSLLW